MLTRIPIGEGIKPMHTPRRDNLHGDPIVVDGFPSIRAMTRGRMPLFALRYGYAELRHRKCAYNDGIDVIIYEVFSNVIDEMTGGE